MAKHRRRLALALLLSAGSALIGGASWAASTCSPDGVQASGSIYRICMPDPADYNGRVVMWAHGFQDANTPVEIPEDQLQLGEISLPEVVNSLGYGFATNSYSKTGLAVRQGMADLIDLVDIYAQQQGTPAKVYLTGASEGGLISALLVERYPDIFDGGVAACGPVGNFRLQIGYLGDARAVFEYFFPGLIPGDPFHPSPALAAGWTEFYEQSVKPVVFAPANRHKLDQLVRVAGLPFDWGSYLETVEVSLRDVLRYAVVNLNDARDTLGGFPFDNTARWYAGSDNDLRLNRRVPRVSADPAAVREMQAHYNTTGILKKPLITLHTLRDQQVPYIHEVLYDLKTIKSGAFLTRHLNIPVDRFEHCNFTAGEAVFAFFLMLAYAGDLTGLEGVGSVLQGKQLEAFEALGRRYGLPYSVAGPLRERPSRR
jgi:pimeloyl-ACP methyl ester carboxylesterase